MSTMSSIVYGHPAAPASQNALPPAVHPAASHSGACTLLSDAKADLEKIGKTFDEFKLMEDERNQMRDKMVGDHFQNHQLIKKNLESVAVFSGRVISLQMEHANKVDEVVAEGAEKLRKLVDNGVTCDGLEEDVFTDVKDHLKTISGNYIDAKKSEEQELLKLRAAAVAVEQTICANNDIIKQNIQRSASYKIDIERSRWRTYYSLILRRKNDSVWMLPAPLWLQKEHEMVGQRWGAFLEDVEACKPSEATVEEVEREFLATTVSASELVDQLFRNKCDKITKVIDDALTLNKLEQKSMESVIAFDESPNIQKLFSKVNQSLVARGELTGMSLTKLMQWGDEIRRVEGEIKTIFDSAEAIITQIYGYMKCLWSKIDKHLEEEINNLPANSAVRQYKRQMRAGFGAAAKSFDDFGKIGDALSTGMKEAAAVVKQVLADFFEDGMTLMLEESRKNALLSEYVAANTTAMVNFFEGEIPITTKAFAGDMFIITGLCVALFAYPTMKPPILPVVDFATYNETELQSFMLKVVRDLLLSLVTAVARKLELGRKTLLSSVDKGYERAKELSQIENNLQNQVALVIPPLMQNISDTKHHFERALKIGVHRTFEEVAKELQC